MPSDKECQRLLKQMCELEVSQKELLDKILAELEDESFRNVIAGIRDEEVRHNNWLNSMG